MTDRKVTVNEVPLRDRKQGVVSRRRAKRQRERAERQRHRRCFWTRPVRHAWVFHSTGYGWVDQRCVGCEWVKRFWRD